MNDRRQTAVIRLKRISPLTPTGPALLALVKVAGDSMLKTLRSGNHEVYLAEREFYLYLLELAQVDEYCARILIPAVQSALDDEALLARLNSPRLDKG